MDQNLLDEVFTRLDADPGISPDIRRLIDAALLDNLDPVVDGATTTRRPTVPPPVPEAPSKRVYVSSINVAGFRGVGPKVGLELSPWPSLTLVVGRNGSGKSSFAEGLEFLLTGDNQRWSKRRTKEWQSGFRNVHAPDNVCLDAELLIEGQQASRARRFWKKDDSLEGGTFTLNIDGTTHNSIADVGWDQSLRSYRPFLSYNEMGSILDQGPATLFDTLNPILGLSDLSEAADRLKSWQKDLRILAKETKSRLTGLRTALGELDDERARAAERALAGNKWELDDVAKIVNQDALSEDSSTSARLATLAQLAGPNLEDVLALATELKEALEREESIRSSDADRAHRLITLLDMALEFREHTGDSNCPVCGRAGALDGGWAGQAAERMAALRKEAEISAAAHQAVEDVLSRSQALLSKPPPILIEAAELDLDATKVLSSWSAWSALREASPNTLVEEIEGRALDLSSAAEHLREAAKERRQSLERVWQAVAREIHAWLPDARKVLDRSAFVKQLAKAEKRLIKETQAIRNDRFAPIKDRVFHFWNLLRARSSVDIEDLALAGTRTRRKVEIDVAVDGTKAIALGVMSQGELHALALSLFLPRATMKESPFSFLFIDDPVQAMDLARVDGLTRVLEEVARTHQVVVFTHDDRLPAAVRRLKIEARILKVERSRDSMVEIFPALDPVKQHLSDAFALAKTQGLPEDIAARVIPGLCRQALEAAFAEVVRRRRLAAGEPHDDVERLLIDNGKLNPLLALVMTDHSSLVEKAKASLKRRIHPRAVEIVERCNRGAHYGWDGDLLGLVEDTQMVAYKIQESL